MMKLEVMQEICGMSDQVNKSDVTTNTGSDAREWWNI
jgi:hypothetical protein